MSKYQSTYTKILEDIIELRDNFTGRCVCHTPILDEFGDHVFKLKEGETYDYVIMDSQGYGRTYRVYTSTDNKEYSLKPELFHKHLIDIKAYRDKSLNEILNGI